MALSTRRHEFALQTDGKIRQALEVVGDSLDEVEATLDAAPGAYQPLDADLTALAALTAPATKLSRLEILADNEETASFTFALTDAQSAMTRANHATVAITATVPLNATVAFPIGSVIHLCQWGAAAVTIAATEGVTINQPASKTLVVAEQYGVVRLWKQATNTWLLSGDLTDA